MQYMHVTGIPGYESGREFLVQKNFLKKIKKNETYLLCAVY